MLRSIPRRLQEVQANRERAAAGMRQLFGTDGIRGVAGEYPLDPRTVLAIGRALGQRLAARSAALAS